jgi:hypothetical protein
MQATAHKLWMVEPKLRLYTTQVHSKPSRCIKHSVHAYHKSVEKG